MGSEAPGYPFSNQAMPLVGLLLSKQANIRFEDPRKMRQFAQSQNYFVPVSARASFGTEISLLPDMQRVGGC